MANRRKKTDRSAAGAISNVRFRWDAAGVACALAVSIVAGVSCRTSGKRQTSPPPQTRQVPWWEAEGLVVALSPRSAEEQAWLMTQRRSKKPTRDELAAYDRIHGEESLRTLADTGVNMLVFPYGGYDPDANEVEARDRAVEVARRCRAVGLRLSILRGSCVRRRATRIQASHGLARGPYAAQHVLFSNQCLRFDDSSGSYACRALCIGSCSTKLRKLCQQADEIGEYRGA